MRKIERAVSAIVLVCFLLSTAVSDLAFSQTVNYTPNTDKLAIAGKTDDMLGSEARDLHILAEQFKAALMWLGKNGIPVTVDGIKKTPDNVLGTVDGIKIFKHEAIENPDGSLIIKARRQGAKVAYLIERAPQGGFMVYPENKAPAKIITPRESYDAIVEGLKGGEFTLPQQFAAVRYMLNYYAPTKYPDIVEILDSLQHFVNERYPGKVLSAITSLDIEADAKQLLLLAFFTPGEIGGIRNGNTEEEVKWITPEEATFHLNAIDAGSVEYLKKLSAWAEKDKPSYLEYLEKFKPGLAQINDILRRTRPVDELNKLVDRNVLVMEGEEAGAPGMYDKQLKRLDILRGISELILQLVPEEKGVNNQAHLSKIKEVFVKHAEFSKSLVNYFETRFDPAKNLNERGKAAGKIRLEKILNMLRTNLKASTPEEHFILEKSIRVLIATTKTNYYVEERINLLFRINARAIVGDDESGALVNTPPSGLIWVHVPYGVYGAHSRYIDDARGGLRRMDAKDGALQNQVLATCGALTVVQNDKHTDIPEAGSKGAYIYKEGLNVVAATIGYVDALITCMKEDDYDRIAVSSDTAMIDPLYLGPDVGTAEFADVVTALAWMKGLEGWRLLMTGKSQTLGGVSHRSNNLLDPVEKGNRVTSQGVIEHVLGMIRYLRDIGKIKSKEGEPLVFTVTGGLDGDVGSGLTERIIFYHGDNAVIRAIVDGSGVMFDPKGLDHGALITMYKNEDTVIKFPVEKLSRGGFIARAKPGAGDDSYITLDNDSLKYMNTRALDPDILKSLDIENQYKARAGLKNDEPLVTVLERDSIGHPSKVKVHIVYLRDAMFFIIKSDILLTGSTGKDNINQKNWPLFFDWEDSPVSVGIVHGANVFIHNNATIELEKKGIVIEPDEKANSVGVEISSRVEIDFNFIFEIKEMTSRILASYFGQVLGKCLENARKKFWALRLEADSHPDESVVTKVSPRISTEIVELASRISRSHLIGDRKSDYEAMALEYLKNYFPDVSDLDKKYTTTLDRVFDRMPVSRIKAIASKVIAKDVVLNLGTGAVLELAKRTGAKQIEVIDQYLKVASEIRVNSQIKNVIDNKEKISPRDQIKKLKALRRELSIKVEAALKVALNIAKERKDVASVARYLSPSEITDDIASVITTAGQAGLQIPTQKDGRYNLLVTEQFFRSGELDAHRAKYGDRFDVDRVSGTTYEQFVQNVLAKASGKETRTVVLVPSDLPNEQLERLTSAGIRFVRASTSSLLASRVDNDEYRAKFQLDTYVVMLLTRAIDDNVDASSPIYRLLSFYLKTHFTFAEKIAIDDYIMAIAKNEIGKLVQGIIAYRPAQAYDKPDYEKVAAALISA